MRYYLNFYILVAVGVWRKHINIAAVTSDQELNIFHVETTCYNLHFGVTDKLLVCFRRGIYTHRVIVTQIKSICMFFLHEMLCK
jgi:hypothetical protein